MPFLVTEFLRAGTLAVALAGILLSGPDALAQQLEVKVMAEGSAASGRPLPVGARPAIEISVRNNRAKTIGPVELSVRSELAADKTEGWTLENGTLKTTIKNVAAGAQVKRELRLRVDKAPAEAAKIKVTIKARVFDGRTVEGETELTVADCAGAYRGKLEALRATISQPMRDAADEMRRADPFLPDGRQFPATGARSGELAQAERLAARFAARRGADPQMSAEWFRYLLLRWASELNAYTGQAPNPGICANTYYQIAGYRQGVLPIAKHIDATHAAAEKALVAARKEAAVETGDVRELVQVLQKEAEINKADDNLGPLFLLADARARSRGRFDPALMRKFSLAETAAWLAEADRRGQKLAQSIEQILTTISTAHKESCNCAF
jgi:hypothetical protein